MDGGAVVREERVDGAGGGVAKGAVVLLSMGGDGGLVFCTMVASVWNDEGRREWN